MTSNRSRVFKLTWDQREHVSKCLRFIDQARKQLAEAGGHDAIVDEMKRSADGIYHLMNELEELPQE